MSDSALSIRLVYFLALLLVVPIKCQIVERHESFSNGNYVVSWVADLDTQIIKFDIRVKTLGYVGFGLSPTGGMVSADIVIGGVYNNGTTYFTDRFGTGTVEPEIDSKQDWSLLSAYENETHTHLLISRSFNTCDDQDITISEDTIKLIWSFGPTDNIQYHDQSRGTKHINFLDPPMPSPDLSKLLKWDVLANDTIPSEKTSYWCTVHKGPSLSKIHHVVGFDKLQENPLAVKHTHHFIFRKCIIPKGLGQPEEIFGEHVGKPGQECSARPLLNYLCSTYMFLWAIGGEKTLFPDHVGLPVGEDPDEYYMLEIHYNNPEADVGLTFETGLEIYYTDDLRENEAGIITVGHVVYWAQTIPPNIQDFTVYGHCGSACTKVAFPEDGINVFNVLLHSHMSGRKLKLHHFTSQTNNSGLVELPWFAYDDKYDFNYQQNRPLREEKKVYPGDHLTFTCTYDTTWRNGSVVIGDLGIEDEMCEAFLFYYPRLEIDTCMSSYNPLWIFSDFGIQAFESAGPGEMDPVITLPKNLTGLRYTDYLNNNFTWSKEFISKYQKRLQDTSHIQVCASLHNISFVPRLTFTDFPNEANKYEPLNLCENKSNPASGAESSNLSYITELLIFSLLFVYFKVY